METFIPGDSIIAINTDISEPIHSSKSMPDAYCFPDGPLKGNTIYFVESVTNSSDGIQGLFIMGLRAFVGKYHVPWSSCRFRKVDYLSGHAANKRRRKKPVGKTAKIRKLATT
jgi:hypothetical protein